MAVKNYEKIFSFNLWAINVLYFNCISKYFFISDHLVHITNKIKYTKEENYCNKVRRKEGSGQGWLVKTQVCLFKTDKLTQVRTLRHPETSTLSFVSAITLCIRSDCFSLTARALESSLRLSPWTAVPRRLLSGLHANYYNQTQVILILHLTHLLTAVSWVFLPLQTSLNHAPLATITYHQHIFTYNNHLRKNIQTWIPVLPEQGRIPCIT